MTKHLSAALFLLSSAVCFSSRDMQCSFLLVSFWVSSTLFHFLLVVLSSHLLSLSFFSPTSPSLSHPRFQPLRQIEHHQRH